MTLAQPENLRISLPLDAIADLCRRYDVEQLSVFGSALRDDFRADSDIDFLVTFKNDDAGVWASKFGDLEHALSELLKRKVDMVSRRAVEQSENYLRRRYIKNSAKTVYVA